MVALVRRVTMTGENGYVFDPVARSKVVPDSPTLSPGDSTFSDTVEIQSDHVPASGTDYDIVRKGVASTSGGGYKLEIMYAKGQGRASCLVKDAAGTSASIKGVTSVTDGQVHTLLHHALTHAAARSCIRAGRAPRGDAHDRGWP
jgi:hypothetical protein